MDTGVLDLAWCQGYDGSALTFIEPEVIIYQCGRNVKTISINGKEGSFSFKGSSIGPMAFHKINKHIAIAEYAENPKIYVYAFPTYSEISVLSDGADLEFQVIAFSESDHLASISGVPNYSLILWNYIEGTKLVSVDITPDPIKSLSFSKVNWRQICLMTDSFITLWNVEQCNTKFHLCPHKIRLPPMEPGEDYNMESVAQSDEKHSARMAKYVVDIPESAIAGLVGEEVELLEIIKDSAERVSPSSMTWLPTGDFYVGCKDGHLFKVDTEQMKITTLYYPSHCINSDQYQLEIKQSAAFVTPDVLTATLKPGFLQCIAYHSSGLYVAGKDGVIRLLDVSKDDIILKEEIIVHCEVSSLAFGQNYHLLAWGSPTGLIQYYTCGNVTSKTTLVMMHSGKVVGVASLPYGSDCSVSLREDGMLQVWKTVDGTFVSSLDLAEQSGVLACSRLAQYAVIGTTTGSICFIDLNTIKNPRLILRKRLFRHRVKHILFNGDEGTLFFVASDTGTVFILDARPSTNFNVIGHVAVIGKVQALAIFMPPRSTNLLVSANNNSQIFGSNLLTKFSFTDEVLRDIHSHYRSSMCDIKDESCKALRMGLRYAICGLAVGEGEVVYAISASTKRVYSFTLPDPEKKLRKIDLLLTPTAEFPGHSLPGGNLLISPNQKWLLTYSTDGSIKIRPFISLERTAIFSPHEYQTGGVQTAAFSDDGQYILSAGYDGIVSCYHWVHLKGKAGTISNMKLKRDRDLDFAGRENVRLVEMTECDAYMFGYRRASDVERDKKLSIEIAKQTAQDRDEIYVSPPPSPKVNATWLEQREIDSLQQEGQTYAKMKIELRTQLRDIRKTILQMMEQNMNLPDIEKLTRNEFDLDLEEQNRFQLEGEAEINKVREKIEFENLAKLYLCEKIKQECWEDMKVKGRAVQAFNSALEVANFPLRERSSETLKLIETVSTRRKIEIRELEARKQIAEVVAKPPSHDEEGENEDQDEKTLDHVSISGSLGSQFGGQSDLFYNQFDLHSREQKIGHIVLVEDAIHRIKEAFNKEFDDVYSKKELEIAKVKEKNKRIAHIIAYLGFNEVVYEPTLSVAERPEQLLEVDENEIKVEKYLTPEQRKILEEERRLEEERLARERGDNARERALEMMMGGVLEIKREDELRKDVPKPPFMLTKKEEEFVEDEQKQYKEYLKKVQELNEEREKFKKHLELELRKLQVTIQESLQAFDDVLNVLFMRKIKVMMVVFQEELKILRLRYAMLMQEEIEVQEKNLIKSLEHKKSMKILANEAIIETRKSLEIFRNEYENLQAEDKYLDKSFKREFSDVSALIADALFKQFKKRPRIHKYRAVDASGGTKSHNPFADRPSSSVQLNYQRNLINMGLEELDKMSNAPDGTDAQVWERMCKLRRIKVESESLLKIKGNVLAEIQSFLHKRHNEEEKLKAEIDEISHKLSKLKEDEQRFNLNLEVQLLLKQGQIEVEAGAFIRDYRDSVLIHRSVVEDLNATIKQLGESKIASMVESKDFRKGIIQLEWEHKKMSMEMEDLESKMKDIQFIKVTREIQAFLKEEDYEAKKAAEISTLEQTIAQLKKHHEKNIQKKKHHLRSLTKGVKSKGASNEKLYAELLDLNVVVNERRHIEEVNGGYHDDRGVEKRYREILQRRKLVDLAKAQAQEIAVLRAEVERLRMRTFPALVQVER